MLFLSLFFINSIFCSSAFLRDSSKCCFLCSSILFLSLFSLILSFVPQLSFEILPSVVSFVPPLHLLYIGLILPFSFHFPFAFLLLFVSFAEGSYLPLPLFLLLPVFSFLPVVLFLFLLPAVSVSIKSPLPLFQPFFFLPFLFLQLLSILWQSFHLLLVLPSKLPPLLLIFLLTLLLLPSFVV